MLEYRFQPTASQIRSLYNLTHCRMRPVQELGFAPLADKDRETMLRRHIPYRVRLLLDAIKHIPARIWEDNRSFESGAVSGRMLLSFLGLGYDKASGGLAEDREHMPRRGPTDDVKAPDVGGRFVELSELTEDESETLAKFIHGANKACAHFTIGSEHELTVPIFQRAVPIILRFLRDCLPPAPLP